MVFSVNQLLTICWPITDLTPGGYLSHTCLSFIGMCCLKGFGVWCRFGLKLGVVFERTVEVYEHNHCLNSKRIREKD